VIKMNDNYNIQNTAIYFILSGPKGFSFSNFKITSEESNKEIKILNKENVCILSKQKYITEENQNRNHVLTVTEFNNSFVDKNIYLLKITLKLENDEEKLKIEFNFQNELVQSCSSVTIQKYQQLFIHSLSFNKNKNSSYLNDIYLETSKLLNNLNNKINDNDDDNITEKYKLSNLQQFVIFKEYLINCKMDYLFQGLLDDTQDTLIKPDEIDFEYVLIYLSLLLNDEKSIHDISKEKKNILKNIISSLLKKEKITVKKYNNYKNIVKLIENYHSNNQNDEITLEKYFFLLIYYQNNINENGNNFDKLFININNKNKVINFMKRNKEIFSNLTFSNLKQIYILTDTSINDVLMFASNFNLYLQVFCSFKDEILEYNEKINFCHCPLPDEKTNLIYFNSFYSILLKMKLNNNNNKYINNIILKLINAFKENNYKKLIKIRDILLKNKRKFIFSSTIKSLEKAIHLTGKYYIENDKWENMEILIYIQDDVKTFYYDHKNDPEYACLISHINIDKIDEPFCQKFFGNQKSPYNYSYQFGKHYDLFISSIVGKVNSYEQLKIIFNLFKIELIPKHSDNIIIENLVEAFRRIIVAYNLEFSAKIKIIYPLLKVISYNNNYYSDRLIKYIGSNFDKKEVNNLFLYMINNNNNNEFNIDLIGILLKNISDLSHDDIIKIIEKNDTNDTKDLIKNIIIQKLNNRMITVDDIFKIEMSDNLKLLKYLINKRCFQNRNINFEQPSYIRETTKVVNNIINKLKKLEISVSQIQSMYMLYNNNNNGFNSNHKNNNLKERFLILSSVIIEDIDISELYDNIVNIIQICIEKLNKIDKIINIFSIYYPNEKHDVINTYKELKKSITRKPIEEFPGDEKLNEYNFENLYREAHQLSKLKNSIIFSLINDNVKSNIEKNKNLKNMDHVIFDSSKKKIFGIEKII